MNKRYTEKTASAVCNRLLKRCKSEHGRLSKGWIDVTGNQCFCDGFRAYRLKTPIDGVPMAEVGEIPVKLDTVFKPLDTGKVVEMPAPDPDDVKSFIEARSDKRGRDFLPYDLGEFFPLVNPEYVRDVLRLFPGAKWYVVEKIASRPTKPVFIVHEMGSACIMPMVGGPEKNRQFTEKPTPTAEAAGTQPPEVDEEAQTKAVKALCTEYAFFIYAKFPGDKKFYLADLIGGAYKVAKLHAPRYKEEDAAALMEALDRAAARNPGADFQLRKLDGKTVVYNAVPTFTPEDFLKRYAA